ncbi:hypothetical protein [Allokutzneria albata]|uniref:Uncharacterized protein n=1 Tax=Allokutzneria albata TaxID=211114 RepID=A0A1G9YPG7_ALLAB|nr:hypothetical protein [Allokutzneria albata]SDN10346.1 hypothetical protein SAMN04489726_4929 [Allokutzneria albata]
MVLVDSGVDGSSGRGVDWITPCTDAYGRSSDFGVIKKPGAIVLVAPPGGAGVFDFGELCELISRLTVDAGCMMPTAPRAAEGESK